MFTKSNIFRMLIWLVFLIGGAILGTYYDKIYFFAVFNNLYFHIGSLIIGYILLRMVLKASRNTGRFLAKMGREGDIPRLQTNKLVTTGLYALMRHPMHQGLWFFPLAFALLVGSPTFILFITPFEMLLMIVMIKIWEEPETEKKFGDAYLQYKKKVPFFCFKPECIRALLTENYDEKE